MIFMSNHVLCYSYQMQEIIPRNDPSSIPIKNKWLSVCLRKSNAPFQTFKITDQPLNEICILCSYDYLMFQYLYLILIILFVYGRVMCVCRCLK